jgi:hypothetical protein
MSKIPKSAALAFSLLVSLNGTPGVAQKQRVSEPTSHSSVNPTDFPLTVHVTGTHILSEMIGRVEVDATIQGHKYQLTSNLVELLHLGDYKGRVIVDREQKSGLFTKTYEVLFADGSHSIFSVVGEISE